MPSSLKGQLFPTTLSPPPATFQKAKLRVTLLSHDCEFFQSYNVEGNLEFGVAEYKDSGSNELEVDFLVILHVELPRFSLDVGVMERYWGCALFSCQM